MESSSEKRVGVAEVGSKKRSVAEAGSKLTLLDLPRDKGIKIYAEMISDGSEYVVFHHIDGMYSLCTTEKGAYVHLKAWTPLVKYKDGYEIDDKHNQQG